MDVSGHLLRRGVSAYLNQPRDDPNAPEKIVYNVPTWVMLMVATTVIGFLFIMVMVGSVFLHAMLPQLTESLRLTTPSDA